MAGARDKIYGAALMLLGEGKKPTYDLVQRATQCSYSTVTKYMKEFREEHKEAIAKAESRREPMPESVIELAESHYNAVLLVAETRINDNRVRSLDEALEQKTRELEEAMSLITDLKARLDERDKKYEQLHIAFMEVVKSKPDIQAVVAPLIPKVE